MSQLPPSRVRAGGVGDAPQVAALHAEHLPEGFLVALGPRFLRRLYARAARSPHAFLVVAEDGGGVLGFLAVAEDTGRFYRDFLVHDGLAAGVAAAPNVARAPRHVWETLRYGMGGGDADLPPAEVLAIAVDGRARGGGVGRALLAAGLDDLRDRGVTAARVVTALDNEPALRMYEGAGFRRHSRVEVHAGVAQQVLVWP
jgi:ribosomal protein S18 acetylase RimI-like enzyme